MGDPDLQFSMSMRYGIAAICLRTSLYCLCPGDVQGAVVCVAQHLRGFGNSGDADHLAWVGVAVQNISFAPPEGYMEVDPPKGSAGDSRTPCSSRSSSGNAIADVRASLATVKAVLRSGAADRNLVRFFFFAEAMPACLLTTPAARAGPGSGRCVHDSAAGHARTMQMRACAETYPICRVHGPRSRPPV